MKKGLFIALIASMVSMDWAKAYEFESVIDVVQVKCEGQLNQFIVNLVSFMDPKDMKVVKSKIDLSLKVKSWESLHVANGFVVEPVKKSGNYVGIEASIEENSAKYRMEVPQWFNYGWNQNSTTFQTALTLKAGVVNGDLNVDCQASLIKGKITNQIQYP